MTKQTKLSPRRAEVLSLLAFGLHLLFFFLTFYLSQRANTLAGKIEAWHFLGGTLIWLICCLLFRQRRLAEDERLDAEQYQRLRREGKDTSVFEGTLVADSLHLAQRRLNWMEKYLQGLFAILLSLYLLGIGYWLYRSLRGAGIVALAAHEVVLETAAFMAVFALVSFLFSRYAVGMSQHRTWRPLRAGGSYLLSNALACFLLAILLLVTDAGYPAAERILSYVLVVTLILLGVEVLLNFVLDAFRPRVKGQYHRAAYESRLLGLFSEPGGILRTFAHAMDYQFGFKVSETWFYRLLEKAIVPLLALMAVALYLLSCFAVVPTGHVGVLERWGRPVNVSSPFDCGLHLKLPWPIDSVRTFPVDNVQILEIGFERGDTKYDPQNPILWTVKHWQDEPPFMVAVSDPNRLYQGALDTARPAISAPTGSGRNNFDLLVVPFIIHYRVADVAAYEYDRRTSHVDPAALLKDVCYRQAVHYCARSNMERLMGPGREQTTRTLRQAIQDQINAYHVGIEIVFVGMGSIHPPVEVAPEFEKVVSALQNKQAEILNAGGAAGEILEDARGRGAQILSKAQAYKVEHAQVAAAEALRFNQQIEAFEKGQSVYLVREYLSVLDEALPAMRKYLIASDQVDHWVYEFDLKEKLQPDLFGELKIPTAKKNQENTP